MSENKVDDLVVLLKPEKQKKTVEDYLDDVDYSWNGYIPTIDAVRYATFIDNDEPNIVEIIKKPSMMR